MKNRLRKLEKRHNPDDWRHWEGVPVQEWPGAALESSIADKKCRIRSCLEEAGILEAMGLSPDTEITLDLLKDVDEWLKLNEPGYGDQEELSR